MRYEDLVISLRKVGKDPSRLIFEDELTGLHNRRFLFQYLESHLPVVSNEHPLSLLMVDLDNLKEINDEHGHAGGDLALILVGRLLKEACGAHGLAVRYAGDEFILLLPDTPKSRALDDAARLLQRSRGERLQMSDTKAVLQPTMSIGIACMPEDAETVERLIERADAALYYAKRTGRNRLAHVSHIRPEEVADRAGLDLLRNASVVGRQAHLAQIAEAYEAFCQGRSQFVVIEGAAGMGKTTVLEVVRDALTNKTLPVVKVSGIRQETYRPYYLAGRILMSLLDQKGERGATVYERLSPVEAACLDTILPSSDGRTATEVEADEKVLREHIFALFVTLVPKLVDFGPMVVLIDDVHLADEATLLALRCVMLRDETLLFVCGTSVQAVTTLQEVDHIPLERFAAAYQDEIGLRKVSLTPLTTTDIQEHLRGVFPRLRAAEDFEENLTQVTQGNPLFLGEILHKLVSDKKITLVGQQWTARPLDESYLPTSVEEIVKQKISALDGESRQLLKHASTLGDDLSLSMLTGSSEQPEARVEDFIEQATELGLITSEFAHDDEAIRFLSRQVLDITYGDIQPEHRQHLHTHIGTYQEMLFRRRALPSASYLAYHFKRSADHDRARLYEELVANQSTKIFNADEAAAYTGDQPGEQLPDIPLAPESVRDIPHVLRSLLITARNVKLYPRESKTLINANRQLLDVIDAVLVSNQHVKFVHHDDALVVNGQVFSAGDHKTLLDTFLEFLRSVELGTLAFRRGLAQQELEGFLQAFSQIKPAQTIERQFWKRFAFDHHLTHIHLTQVKYVERTVHRIANARTGKGLDGEQLRLVRELIHHLLGTARNIKLYPRHSRTVSSSFDRLTQALGLLVSAQQPLILARARNSLLVNGEKIDVTEFKGVAGGFVEFLSSIGLKSITFLANVSSSELDAFLTALRDLPAQGGNPEYWMAMAHDQRVTRILFDEYDYGIESTEGSGPAAPEESGTDAADESGPDAAGASQPSGHPQVEVPFDDLMQRMPQQVNDLLLRGETARLRQLLGRTFTGFSNLDAASRQKLIEVCRSVFDTLPFGFKPVWSNLVADPLIVICGEEKDPKIFVVLPNMLRTMAEDMISFAEYLLTARIFSRLVALYRDLEKTQDPRARILGEMLERKPDGKIQKLLVHDLKSGDARRQQAVVQVLGSLGPSSLYLLIEIIKTEDDLRVRQLAARLLADLGHKAGEAIKRELALEVTAQGRCRMLEVIDTVTQSLETELAFVLGDTNDQVRNAAFQLAERLHDDRVTAFLLTCVASEDLGLAIGAIRSLGKLKPAGASARVIAVLHSTKDTELAVACCQALGAIADEPGIEALARVLATRGFLYLGKRWHARVRGAAAFALRAIPTPRVSEVMSSLRYDRDSRVRRIAKSFLPSSRT